MGATVGKVTLEENRCYLLEYTPDPVHDFYLQQLNGVLHVNLDPSHVHRLNDQGGRFMFPNLNFGIVQVQDFNPTPHYLALRGQTTVTNAAATDAGAVVVWPSLTDNSVQLRTNRGTGQFLGWNVTGNQLVPSTVPANFSYEIIACNPADVII